MASPAVRIGRPPAMRKRASSGLPPTAIDEKAPSWKVLRRQSSLNQTSTFGSAGDGRFDLRRRDAGRVDDGDVPRAPDAGGSGRRRVDRPDEAEGHDRADDGDGDGQGGERCPGRVGWRRRGGRASTAGVGTPARRRVRPPARSLGHVTEHVGHRSPGGPAGRHERRQRQDHADHERGDDEAEQRPRRALRPEGGADAELELGRQEAGEEPADDRGDEAEREVLEEQARSRPDAA